MKSVNLLCSVCIMAFALQAEDYKVQMSSNAEVGDKYLKISSGTSSEHMSIIAGGKSLKNNRLDIKANLEGIVTVLKIDKLKRARQIKFVVTECLASYGDNLKKMEILQKDSEIIIERQEDKTVFLFHDKPLPPRISKVLDLFFSMPHSDTTDNDIFAPKERKKVGDTWSINNKRAAADFSASGLKVAPEDIKGSVTLEKTLMVGKTECLFLKAEIEMENMGIPLPPVLTVKKSTMSAVFSGEFPVEPDAESYDTLSSSKTFLMEMEAEGQPAPDKPMIKMSMKMKKTVKEQVKALK